jgi:hypothetical protein
VGVQRHFGCSEVRFRIVSRRAAYVSHPPGVKKTGGCLFVQPAPALAPVRTPVSEKVYESTVNCALLFPFAVTLRRSHDACINQRIDSLPCPALFLNVSGAASPRARERSCERPRVPLARIHQTTTISPAGLCCWLDYVGGEAGGGELEVGSHCKIREIRRNGMRDRMKFCCTIAKRWL